jgi:hypothetical protein
MCDSVPSHRATHRLLCSNSSPRKAFLSSVNHRNLRISLRVTFGCSLLLKWASRGRVSQPWKTSNATTELRKIPKEAFGGCFQQWQDRWSKCVCVCVCVCACARAGFLLRRWLGKRCHMSNHYSAIPHFRERFDRPSYIESNRIIRGSNFIVALYTWYPCQWALPYTSVSHHI